MTVQLMNVWSCSFSQESFKDVRNPDLCRDIVPCADDPKVSEDGSEL